MNSNDLCNYFIYNGKKYYTGTVLKVKDMGQIVDAVFICSYYSKVTNGPTYVYKLKNGGGQRNASQTPFSRCLVEVTNAVDHTVSMPKERHVKDSNIEGLALGWLWYIFLMAISIIFKDAIGLWILISVVFFSWRANKIKEEGTYIEW